MHNVAQLAHACAQGKVGSGFDVSAAVYGTQTYKRFDAGSAEEMFSHMNDFAVDVVANKLATLDVRLGSSLKLYDFIQAKVLTIF